MTLMEFHARVFDFVKTYGGDPPGSNDPRCFELLSDFLLVIDAEMDFKIRKLDREMEGG